MEIIEDHSVTCKFLAGNQTVDLKKYAKSPGVYCNRVKYKTMKIEVEKKLEDEDWLTPGEVLDWIKKEFPTDMHLSYSQNKRHSTMLEEN